MGAPEILFALVMAAVAGTLAWVVYSLVQSLRVRWGGDMTKPWDIEPDDGDDEFWRRP